MQSVMVLGGTHPDELEAMRCVDSLKTNHLPNVKGEIANPLARSRKKRFVDVNMVGAFPGSAGSRYYEKRRAAQLVEKCQVFDIVIDLHNINNFGENTAVIDAKNGVSPLVFGFLRSLGIRNLVLAQGLGIQGYHPNAFALETLASGLGKNISRLRAAFERLANDPDHPQAKASDFNWYEFLGSPHKDLAHPDDLSSEQRRKRPRTKRNCCRTRL